MLDEYDDDTLRAQRVEAQRDRPVRPRDPKIDEAKQAVVEFFPDGGTDVYYGRQIEILLEKGSGHESALSVRFVGTGAKQA